MINLYKDGERYYLDQSGVTELAKIETVNVFKARPKAEKPIVKERPKLKTIWIRDEHGRVIGMK